MHKAASRLCVCLCAELEEAEGDAGAKDDDDDDDGEDTMGAAGKQNRNEKKARKALQKLGLKPVPGVLKVTVKKSRQVRFAFIESPCADEDA